jgi:predicted RND superfamily exporter protein
MGRLLGFVTGRAGSVLVLVLLLTLAAATRIVDVRTGELRIDFDPSTNALLPQEDEGRAFYDRVRRIFGNDETILVALVDDDVFTAANLRSSARISERIAELDGVHHVTSLANALNIRSVDGELVIEPFVEDVPDDPAALAEIRRQALGNPIYSGNLVSGDGRIAAILVYLMDMPEREFLARGLDREIRRIAEEERGTASVWITGSAYVKAKMSRVLLDDLLRTLPLASAALVLVSFLSFRRLLGALVPLAAVGIALVWTLAFLALLGESLNVITVVLPPLILVVGFAYSVHVVAEYYDLLRHGEPLEGGAAREALRLVALPVLLTAATTAVGFLSLATSHLVAIRDFGLYAAVGVLATFVVSLTFVPALLQVLPTPRRPDAPVGSAWFDRQARRLAEADVRHRRAIFLAMLLVGVVSAAGVTRIQVSTDVVRLFDPETEVRRHFEAINEQLEGSDALYVVLAADYTDAFKEPVNLRLVKDLQAWLEAQPEIGGTTSVVDYVEIINRGFHDDDPAQLAIPDSKNLVAQLMFFGANDEVESFVDSRYQTVNVVARSRAIDSGDVTALARRIEAHLEGLPPHLTGRVTGNSVLIARTSDEIARGQALSLALAFFVIYAILCLLFMSLRVGFLALLPNAIPVLVYFGTLGLTGVTLNTTTGLVACLVLGIAVDDTIHILARFNACARRLASEARGAVEALVGVARPVTYTSVALCLGFLAITTSSLQNQRQFGALAAFTLFVAWLADVTFTPALAARMRIVTLWDVLSLDLGEEPHRSIPLFRGLSKHQARIAALMTSLRSFPRGERLLRQGEEGDEVFVVIHGELVASVPARGGVVQVKMGRGEVVGEVALFHGTRTADVECASDVTLLRLTRGNLDRLRRRYPRIAAQLLSNLSAVLAERLARSTERSR